MIEKEKEIVDCIRGYEETEYLALNINVLRIVSVFQW